MLSFLTSVFQKDTTTFFHWLCKKVAVHEQGVFGLQPRSGSGDSSARPIAAQQVVAEQLICSKGLWVPSSVQLQAILLAGY